MMIDQGFFRLRRGKRDMRRILLALVLAGATPALVQAQTVEFEPMPKFTPDIGTLRISAVTQNSRQDLFQLLDASEDGVIDRAEWRDRKMLVFYIRDNDRDLQLSASELEGIPVEAFAAADQNNDGKQSGFEFNQAEFTRFEWADANGDGVVTFEEFSSALDNLQR